MLKHNFFSFNLLHQLTRWSTWKWDVTLNLQATWNWPDFWYFTYILYYTYVSCSYTYIYFRMCMKISVVWPRGVDCGACWKMACCVSGPTQTTSRIKSVSIDTINIFIWKYEKSYICHLNCKKCLFRAINERQFKWKIPDCFVFTQEAIDIVDLARCQTKFIESAHLEICTRPNTFVLDVKTSSAITRWQKFSCIYNCIFFVIRNRGKRVFFSEIVLIKFVNHLPDGFDCIVLYNVLCRRLFSTDNREDFTTWSESLNKTLHNLHLWNEDESTRKWTG